jgi:hypothetical protein
VKAPQISTFFVPVTHYVFAVVQQTLATEFFDFDNKVIKTIKSNM